MSAKTEFNAKGSQKKREAPFSLRLTFEERTKLEAAANGVPLGTYIKAVLFGGDLQKVRRRGAQPMRPDSLRNGIEGGIHAVLDPIHHPEK